MGKMSDLSIDIQNLLESEVAPAQVAAILQVDVSLVYDVIEQIQCMEEEQAFSEMPELPPLTDNDLLQMAEYYGYGREEYCEFDA